MKVLEIKERTVLPGAIYEAVSVLREGGAVVFPTDTLYALGVDATSKEAVKRLFQIKNRPASRPVPIFVKDIAMAKRYAYVDYGKDKILEKLWPGAVTVVLYKKTLLPDLLTAGGNTVGVRVPDHEIPRLLVKALNSPITATSANISDKAPSGKIAEIMRQFRERDIQPDLVLDMGDLPQGRVASTVIDLSKEIPKVLRTGPVSKEELHALFGLTSS